MERYEALAKVATVAEQMRRRAEAAETQAERMGDAADEFWAMIERLEAQLAGAVEERDAVLRWMHDIHHEGREFEGCEACARILASTGGR